MSWGKNKANLKQVMLFLLKAPSKFVISALLLRAWLFVGLSIVLTIIIDYIGSPPPIFKINLSDRYVDKTGVQRVAKSKMHYINLRVSEDNNEFYFAGIYRNKVDFLNNLIGETMTICFYANRQCLIYFNQYLEIIYQDQRVMNNYEERRLNQLNRLQYSKNYFGQLSVG
ncbi:MAG: hypothetical protein ACJAZP_002852 [Psychromonas sp.]|jgi:hypothetical protein|uniref:hypothetical protein n=1 Tax=Psychromonas sp. TaxID=1884585 RepID=UPI0039E6A551